MLTLQHLYEPESFELLHIHQDAKEKKLYCILQSRKASSHCPKCCNASSRKHSRYGRVVKDLPFMDYQVELRVIVRKFFCDEPLCEQRIFTKRDLSLFEPYSRRTARMEKSLRSIAFSTSAEQGSRLSAQMNVPVSADTLLRLIRKTPIGPIQPSDAVGVDDWAYLKRQRYGVLICDLHTHRPIGLLKEFSSAAVSKWLNEHENIKIVSRDGSFKFKNAIQESNHTMTQVADRWHLIHNLNERMDRILPQSVDSRIPVSSDDSSLNQDPESVPTETTREKDKRKLMEQTKALGKQGFSYTSIANQLKMNQRTVVK